MVVNTLNSLPDFNVYGELFVKTKSTGKSFTHEQKVQQDMVRRYHRNSYKMNTFPNIDTFLDNIYERGKNVGFKLLHPHLRKRPAGEAEQIISYINNNDIFKIMMWRENRLKRVLSNVTNRKKGKVFADPAVMVRGITKGLAYDKELMEWFGNGKFIRISYEELTGDRNADVLDLSFLGIKKKVEVPLKKYGSHKMRDRISNYDELKKYIEKNTPEYARWLE
jgi:hypothetical protein